MNWHISRDNAAARLAALLAQVSANARAHQNDPAVAVWAKILSIREPQSAAAEREVARSLGLLQVQAETLRRQLRHAGKREASFAPILARVEGVLSVRNLGSSWVNTTNQLSPELHSSLELMAEFVPEESDEVIPPETLTRLRDEVHALYHKISTDDDLPLLARHFLLDQLDLQLRALREYPLVGFSAFGRTAVDAAAAWMERAAEVEPVKHRSEVAEVRGFWAKAEKAARRTILIGTAASTVFGGAAKLLGIAKELRALPSGAVTEPLDETTSGGDVDGNTGTVGEPDH